MPIHPLQKRWVPFWRPQNKGQHWVRQVSLCINSQLQPVTQLIAKDKQPWGQWNHEFIKIPCRKKKSCALFWCWKAKMRCLPLWNIFEYSCFVPWIFEYIQCLCLYLDLLCMVSPQGVRESSNYVCKPTFCVMPKKLGFWKGHPNPNPRRNGGLPHGVNEKKWLGWCSRNLAICQRGLQLTTVLKHLWLVPTKIGGETS